MPFVSLILFDATIPTPFGWDASGWGAFFRTLFWDFGWAQLDAMDRGYYRCMGDKLIPFKGLGAAAGAKVVEEVTTHAAETYGSRLAGAYYHLKDGVSRLGAGLRKC